jgi:hypothetical protein
MMPGFRHFCFAASLAGYLAWPLRGQTADELASIDFNADAGHGNYLSVMVTLPNGEKAPFAIDTGCGMTHFDSSLLPLLGRKISSTKAVFPLIGATLPATIHRAPVLRLGAWPLPTGRYVACEDFSSGLKKMSDCPSFVGILGLDCFDHQLARFDFPNHRLVFLRANSPPQTNWGTPFPLRVVKKTHFFFHPWNEHADVRPDFAGNPKLRLTLDTGLREEMMLADEPFRNALAALRPELVPQFRSTRGYDVLFDHVAFGELTYTNMFLAHGDQNLIGLNFLARHQVTLDFPRHRLYLKPVSN